MDLDFELSTSALELVDDFRLRVSSNADSCTCFVDEVDG
jgi:hypothetical protein